MKKKKMFLLGTALLMTVLIGSFKTSEAVVQLPGDDVVGADYQAMRYCGSRITYACTTKTTALKCSKYYCKVTY